MSKEKVIEYVMNSPHNTNRAVLEGLLDGMGGDEYTFLFEEEVTTATENMPFAMGNFSYNEYINADIIKVTFDGVEYQCDLITMGEDSCYGAANKTSGGPDFSEYPFAIVSNGDGNNMIVTQTSSTHTVKVEALQSSSSSSDDWSTAEVTFLNNSTTQNYYVEIALVTPTNLQSARILVPSGSVPKTGDPIPGEKEVTIPLYKQTHILDGFNLSKVDADIMPITSGAITFENNYFFISGDGTIELSGKEIEEGGTL